MRTPLWTLSDLRDAYFHVNGRMAIAAELCGVTRDAIYKYCQDHPEFKAEIQSIRIEFLEVKKARAAKRLLAA